MSKASQPVESQQARRTLAVGPLSAADKWFFRSISVAANFAFVLVGMILVFLFVYAWPALQQQGPAFIFGHIWSAEDGQKVVMQLGPMLWGSVLIAILGICLATPMAVATAYLIVFLLPKRLARIATMMVDLLAALPSVVIGLWGLLVFTPVAENWAKTANQAFGWFPLFHVKDPSVVMSDSPFIAGWIVAVMIVPIITSVTREIFSQLDDGLINGALALGGSKFSVLRRVILPTSAPGIIGAVLLGMGRAIGETVAILYVLQLSFDFNWYSILEPRGGAVASWILARFGEANNAESQGLMAAGLILFIMTLLVNLLANTIVNRSKAARR